VRCKDFRCLGLILFLILPLQLAGCEGGEDPTARGTSPVVVFSDVHFDPLYDQTLFQALSAADPSQWASIFQTSSQTAPSTWGSDTNYPLLALALSSIRQNLGASPFVIFTGDILGHYLPQRFYDLYDPGNAHNPTPADVAAMKAFTDKAVTFFMQQVRASVGTLPVMFALGNADSYTGLGPDSSFLSDTAELYYAQFVSGTVDHEAFLNTFKSGGYYSAEPAGTNLMVIGLNTFEFSPFFNALYSDAVAAQLAWLDSTLASAQARGKKVWLLMHVPPGADKYSTAKSVDANGHLTTATMMWNQDYQTRFLQVLARYPELIAHTLSAHTHMDEYRIMSPSNVVETTPSIAPYFGNNPAFKRFAFFSDTLRAFDYTSLNYDLATLPTQFNPYYTYSTAYSLPGDLTESLAQLYPQLAASSVKQSLYRGSYFSGHDYVNPVGNDSTPITDKTWPVYWCGIAHMDQDGLIACVNSH
jgi:sphingomyelin phosphodiesterase acid-like 3